MTTEIDLYISGDLSVIELENNHVLSDTILHIHNDLINPATCVYMKMPVTNTLLNFHSTLKSDDPKLDLMILLNQDTYIHNGIFRDFTRVLITDKMLLEQSANNVILDTTSNHDTKLTVNNFRTNEGYLVCKSVDLLGGGIAKSFLGIILSNKNSKVSLKGSEEHFVVGNLDIQSELEQLIFDKVYVTGNFQHQTIHNLLMKKTIAGVNLLLDNIEEVSELSLTSKAQNNTLNANSINITNLFFPGGKLYISAKSYINFKMEDGGRLQGIDLVLDMSSGNDIEKKILFPAKAFNFEYITIIEATDVSILTGGNCKEIIFQNCLNVNAQNITASEVRYNFTGIPNLKGKLYFSGEIYNNLLISGHVEAIFYALKVGNLEGMGLCSFNFHSSVDCRMLKLNLDVNAFNPPSSIYSDSNRLSLRIDNNKNHSVVIDTVLAKLSTFHVKGNAKLGDILIQPINSIHSLFWINSDNYQGLKVNRIAILSNCILQISPDGTIHLIQNSNLITEGSSGNLYASVTSVKVHNFMQVNIGGSIIFDGKLQIEEGDGGLRSKYGNIFINGHLIVHNMLSIIADRGLVYTQHATLEAKAITIYSGTNSYFEDTIMKAFDIVAFSLSGYIGCKDVNLRASNIALISGDDINITNSTVNSNKLFLQSNSNTNINNSNIITQSLFVESMRNFLIVSCNIDLLHYQHVLFVEGTSNLFAQGGIIVAKDVQVVGIFGADRNEMLADISWQKVDFRKSIVMDAGCAYIDSNNGTIIGSNLNVSDSVIIRTANNLDIVPLVLHNEVIDAGGYNKNSIREVVTKINAGLIDIKAGNSAVFISTLLKAVTGIIDADIITILNTPEQITKQQERIRILKQFGNNVDVDTDPNSISYNLDFSKATSISQRIGNLSIYNSFKSSELYFTQKQGDIVLDKSWHNKYEKLYLNAERKILIVSNNLQNIYQSTKDLQAVQASRTVIGGDNIYLSADEVVVQGGRIDVKNELKIVTKHGVHILPVAVHQSLMYHMGSKTKVTESIVRQVVSEINAGYIQVKAGGVMEVVSSLIQATGVDLNVCELILSGEREIFEKNVYFTGTKKWYGGRNQSHDYYHDKYVIPSIIKATNLNAVIDGETTIEAAQILTATEANIIAEGNLHLLPKYDIHLHDHTSKSAFLFRFHKGKCTVAGTKSVKEHFYGSNPVPTVIYSNGEFYGYSDGSIHILGAKIIANNIYLAGKKGVKLEASPFHQEQMISITQKGIRCGYNVGSGEYSVSSELFVEKDKQSRSQLWFEAAEVIARNQLIIQSDETIEVISSKLNFQQAQIKARDFVVRSHVSSVQQQQEHLDASIGVRAGIKESISSTVKLVGDLLNKSGTHWLDILDRGLNTYQLANEIKSIYSDIQTLANSTNFTDLCENAKNLKTVQCGFWGQGDLHYTRSEAQQNSSVESEFKGRDLIIVIAENTNIEGIKCQVNNLRLDTKNLNIQPGKTQSSCESFQANVNITVPICGNVPTSVNMDESTSEVDKTSYHSDNMINVKGVLTINIEENGRISGVKLFADEVNIKAKNLILESLQDVLNKKMQSMQIGFSFGSDNSSDNISFDTKTQAQSSDAAWTKAIGAIIGRSLVNITVQQTLELAGGLIANADMNADGTLTDQGRLKIEAGTIIARKLYDYDNGYSYGVGINLSRNTDKNGDITDNASMPVIYSFDERSRDILPTIGNGDVVLKQEIQGYLNRDIAQHVSNEQHEKASLDAHIPISDIWNALKPKAVGVAAGDDNNSKIIIDEEEKDILFKELDERQLHNPNLNENTLESFKQEIKELFVVENGNCTLKENLTPEQRKMGVEFAQKYYNFLKNSGIIYGEAALQVVNNEGFFGKVANIHLRIQAMFEGIPKEKLPELQDRIKISLAYADISERIDNKSDFSYKNISEYHKEIFRKEGLSAYAWGGLVIEEILGQGKWMILHDKDEIQLTNILKHMVNYMDNKSNYSNHRMIFSMFHSLGCYATGETDYQPIIRSYDSKEKIATDYGVSIDSIEVLIDETSGHHYPIPIPGLGTFPQKIYRINPSLSFTTPE